MFRGFGRSIQRHWVWLVVCRGVVPFLLTSLPVSALAAGEQFALRVVTDDNYPPYVFRDAEGQPAGYVVDLWRLWEKKSGTRVEFKAMQWAEAQQAMHDGQADVIDMIFRTPVREQLYDYSQPYANLPVNIYVDTSIHGVKSVAELAGFTVGVQRGDACVDRLSSLGISRLAAYPNYEAILAATQAGDIKIFCMDEAPANYYLYLYRDKVQFSRAFKLYEGQFHWAVNKGDLASFTLVNHGMALITAAEREELREKWFSQPFEFRPYLQLLLMGAVVSAALVSIAGLWIWMLRKAVQARTAEIRLANQELQSEKARLRTIIDNSPDGIALKDPNGIYLDCNAGVEAELGWPKEQIVGKSDADIFADPGTVDAIRSRDLQVMRSGLPLQYEHTLTLPSGGTRDIEVVKVPILDKYGHNSGVLMVARDITERRHAERELRIASVAFQSHDALMIVSPQGVIERVNAAFTRVTGFSPEEALGQTPRLLKSYMHTPEFYDGLWHTLQQQGHWQGEVVNKRRDGSLYTARLSVTAVKDLDSKVLHYIGDLQDITDEKMAREQAEHLKLYDPLTELPNRSLLEDRMRHALDTSEESGELGALNMLNLDLFSKINDSLGHACGDQLLVEIAKRIRSVVGEGATVARFSGDTFALVVEGLGPDRTPGAIHARSVAEAVRRAVEVPVQIDGHKLVATASVGTTLFCGNAVSPGVLVRQAELAMYKSKSAGRNQVHFFEDAMQEEIDRYRWLEEELREAVERRQFTLHYQLQVDELRRPIGAEALIRWLHPKRGVVSPAEFIPLAEETGLIEQMGHWALATVCDQLAQWGRDEELCHLTLAVNLSPRQFKAENFVQDVVGQIRRSAAPVERLKLEVTESLAIDSFDDSIGKLKALHSVGLKISLDDFGTGNSSLNYLTRLPLSQLKIDKSFVDALPESVSDALVAQAIIAMGHGLGLDVIAEGVETAAQQICLANMGCKAFQGYHLGKPLPIADFEQAVRRLSREMAVS